MNGKRRLRPPTLTLDQPFFWITTTFMWLVGRFLLIEIELVPSVIQHPQRFMVRYTTGGLLLNKSIFPQTTLVQWRLMRRFFSSSTIFQLILALESHWGRYTTFLYRNGKRVHVELAELARMLSYVICQ